MMVESVEGPRGVPTPALLASDHSFDECEGCRVHVDDWWGLWERAGVLVPLAGE